MAIPFNLATAAYGNASKLISQAGKSPAIETAGQGANFAQMLADNLQGVLNQGRAADQTSMDLISGKASIVDAVTALSQTELAIDSMVTVRDRVISAYEEIMKMPI